MFGRDLSRLPLAVLEIWRDPTRNVRLAAPDVAYWN
jgi:hypothetical protein